MTTETRGKVYYTARAEAVRHLTPQDWDGKPFDDLETIDMGVCHLKALLQQAFDLGWAYHAHLAEPQE